MAWNFYFLLSCARNCFTKTPYTVSELILMLLKDNSFCGERKGAASTRSGEDEVKDWLES